jgi:autotransporter-associated beta strand protein
MWQDASRPDCQRADDARINRPSRLPQEGDTGGNGVHLRLLGRISRRLKTCTFPVSYGAILAIAGLMPLSSAHAQYVVTETTDNGLGNVAGTLSNAILQANATGGTITFSLNGGATTLTLTGSMYGISAAAPITISGPGITINANNFQPFTVNSGNVDFQNLTIANGRAQGQAGGNGNGGGGGGGGFGGAIYLDPLAGAIGIQNVVFAGNAATGGAGGSGDGVSANGGNGGGYNGNAGPNTAPSGTGGGAGAVGAGDGTAGGYGGGGGGGSTGATVVALGNGGGNGGLSGVGGTGGAGLGGALFVGNGNTTTVRGGTVFNGDNTVSGGTGGSPSALVGRADGGAIYVGIASQLILDNSTTDIIVKGSIASHGFMTIQGGGSGKVIFAGTTNSHTDINPAANTTISSGALQIGNGGTSGTISGAVVNNSMLIFDRSDASTFEGQLSGIGSVEKRGAGTLTFTGIANTTAHFGATTLAGGVLNLGTAALTNTSVINFTGGTLQYSAGNQFDYSSRFAATAGQAFRVDTNGQAVTYASALASAGGSLTKLGNGTLTLTDANTYSGGTTISGGTLAVNGSIASSSLTTVNGGGTLGGNGTVGNTTINGGTLAPGNSIGTLTVAGNLVFTAAASYMVEVSPASADRTNVSGAATLGGATVNASFAPGSYVVKQYTVLNATGGLGGSTFGSVVNSNLPGGFATSLSYDANNAYLNLALAFVPPPGGGLSGNQQSVGNAIIGFFNSTGGIPLVFGGLTPAGLTQISGEAGTGSQQTTFNAMGQFMGVMTDPFVAGRADGLGTGSNGFSDQEPLAYSAGGKSRSKGERDAHAAVYTKAPPLVQNFEQRWSVWAAGYGGTQRTDGNAVAGSNDTRSSIYGTAVGASYGLSPHTLAGFALAGGGTNFSVNGSGSGRSDLFQAGAFIRHHVGPAYIAGALAYGWQDITTDRTVTVAGVDRLRSQFEANAWSGRLEGGYRFVTRGLGITPYAAGQFTTFQLPAYTESVVSGANTFALAYGSKGATNTRSEFGLRTDKSFAMQNAILTLRGRAAWAHDFNPDRAIGATFQTLPGASFVVNGARQAADAALVTGSAELKWINGWSAATTFEGEFSNVTRSYAGKGVVRYAW